VAVAVDRVLPPAMLWLCAGCCCCCSITCLLFQLGDDLLNQAVRRDRLLDVDRALTLLALPRPTILLRIKRLWRWRSWW